VEAEAKALRRKKLEAEANSEAINAIRSWKGTYIVKSSKRKRKKRAVDSD